MPQVDQDVRCRLASVCVEDTDIKVDWNTSLALTHVLTERVGLRPNIGSGSDLRNKDAGIILDGLVVGRLGMNGYVGVPGNESVTLG